MVCLDHSADSDGCRRVRQCRQLQRPPFASDVASLELVAFAMSSAHGEGSQRESSDVAPPVAFATSESEREGSEEAPAAESHVAGLQLASEAHAAGLAPTRAPRSFILHCRKCYALMDEGSSACHQCGATQAPTTRAEDRQQRVRHRPTHAKAKRALVDDNALKGLRLDAPSVDAGADANETEYQAAMQADIAAIADTTVGAEHVERRAVIDH